jgi:hypothetical protein
MAATCTLIFDARHGDRRALEDLGEGLLGSARAVAREEGCTVQAETLWRSAPVAFVARAAEAVAALGAPHPPLVRPPPAEAPRYATGRSNSVERTSCVWVRTMPGASRIRSSVSSRWAVSRVWTSRTALASPATV